MSAPSTVTPVLPHAGDPFDVTGAEGRSRLEAAYTPGPGRFVRLNMITTLTGAAVGADGTSDTISSRVDRTVLGVIRGHADAVLVGAQTVRAEGYALPRRARLAIVTGSGDLGGHELRPSGDARPVLVVCPASRAERVRERVAGLGAEIVAVPDPDGADAALAPRAILDALADLGLESIALEGGPTLAGQFFAAGAIDEACITVAPRLTPVAAPFVAIAEHVEAPSVVCGMLVDAAGFSYLRLRAPE